MIWVVFDPKTFEIAKTVGTKRSAMQWQRKLSNRYYVLDIDSMKPGDQSQWKIWKMLKTL
jgi:hypothetical protein